jgi:hypothetical protein
VENHADARADSQTVQELWRVVVYGRSYEEGKSDEADKTEAE